MQIIEGNALAKLCNYSFGDHHVVWDKNLTGTYEVANIFNAKFLMKAKGFEGRVMTLFIDNIRLYGRALEFSGAHAQRDAEFISYLMQTNDLLNLCGQLPKNKFIIFTSHEDTPIDDRIQLPENVLKIYAVNALYNNNRIIPFPIGLQRQIGENDTRLEMMEKSIDIFLDQPNKLLYINCGIERNPERAPLAKFETNDWCTTRFDKDSKFFPYERYNEFLSELRDHKFVACPKGHGYDTHRIWETLYMRRVPVMLEHPYFYKLLKDFPIYWVDHWFDLTEEKLKLREDLYQQAQTMDMNKLDLTQIYNQCVKI